MRFKILSIGAVLLTILVASAWAADVTGKWTAQVPGRQGTTETTFNFKVEGEELTGTVSSPRGDTAITDGKISGDEISFAVPLSFGDNEIKLLYKGKVSGDEIKFTREMERGAMGGPGGPGGPGDPGMMGGGPGGPGDPGMMGGSPGGPGGPGRGPRQPQEFVAKRAN